MNTTHNTTTKNQKLIISVIEKDDAPELMEALQREGYGSIILSSTGGFLRRGKATILTLVNKWYVDAAIKIIQESASERTEVRDPGISLQVSEWYVPESMQVHTGGASVWVLDATLAGVLPRIIGQSSGKGKDERPGPNGPRTE